MNHSFQTNPNRITNCFKLFSLLQLTTTLLLRRFLIENCSIRLFHGGIYISHSGEGAVCYMFGSNVSKLTLIESDTKTSMLTLTLNSNAPILGAVNHYVSNRSLTGVREIGEYLSEGAAREWSTVVKIFIPPPSFKLVLLSLSRISSILKYPNKSFLTYINIFDSIITYY